MGESKHYGNKIESLNVVEFAATGLDELCGYCVRVNDLGKL